MKRFYLFLLSPLVLHATAYPSHVTPTKQSRSSKNVPHRRTPFYSYNHVLHSNEGRPIHNDSQTVDGDYFFYTNKGWKPVIQDLVDAVKKTDDLTTLEKYCKSSKLTAHHLFFALIQAVQHEDILIIGRLLALGADLNGITGTDVNGRQIQPQYTPLMHAAIQGRQTVTKFLLENGAWVNVQGYDQHTALTLVAKRLADRQTYREEDQSIRSILLEHGADPHIQPLVFEDLPLQTGPTEQSCSPKNEPMQLSPHQAYNQVLHSDEGRYMEKHNKILGGAYFRYTNHGWDAVIQDLIDAVKKTDNLTSLKQYCRKSKLTKSHLFFALIEATQYEDPPIIERLLALGADLNGIAGADTLGPIKLKETPLMCAASHGNQAVMQFLLDKGAWINVQGFDRHTAFTLAISMAGFPGRKLCGDLSILSTLLAHGANPHVKTEYHTHPLLIALKNNSDNAISVAQWLVENTAIDVKQLDGQVKGGLVSHLRPDNKTPAKLAWLKAHGARTE